VATAHERDGPDTLHVAAGHRAAAAEDARLPVEHEERLGDVRLEPAVRGVAGARQAVAGGGGAELLEGVALVRRPRRRGEHREREIEHGPAHADGVGVLGADDHALPRRQVAGRGQAALALDVDEAGATGAERGAVGVLAELGQRDAEAIHGIQHRGASGDLYRRFVDGDVCGRGHRGLRQSRLRSHSTRGAGAPAAGLLL
jgi:hypothetical protein